ncbi:uncharacterized protein BP5553_08706 [Venustampulla echinocandica]|uniref:Rhodopsin domain-containing protein n=1 Tax=Venustampulla echinocandica TaxID=2656787 RepID=A0A370TEZ3_9HELO|nr:uncharacterized protein BP5553_08706 [Venustampulla echinocandica]RDL33267.1 hypothetical protein BP5553_08706 [Venustampulla echinocandica]
MDGSLVALVPPPPGQVANLVNPPSIGYKVIIANAVVLTFSTIVTGARLFTRIFIVKDIGFGDYFLVAAWVFSVGAASLTCLNTRFGLGIHLWNVPASTSPNWLKVNWAAIFFYYVVMMLVKMSLLTLYLRLSPNKRFRLWVWAIMAFVIASSIGAIFTNLFACKPLALVWNKSLPGSCIDPPTFLLVTGCINVLTDFLMILLPIILLWTIQMRRKQKIAVIAILMLGSSVCVMSIVRLRYATVAAARASDITYTGVNLWIWSDLELHTAVLCANLPLLKPFIRCYFPVLFSEPSMPFYNIPDPGASGRNCRSVNAAAAGNQITLQNMDHIGRATSDKDNHTAVGWQDTESQEAIPIIAKDDVHIAIKPALTSNIQGIRAKG